ncbi:hypothetical protein PHMEG_0005630 [Phytophthora megakarya]|uniref:MULE transposase domain-containing protein n=1 Tax=Phytophthora megakarya TaxID=4795 RepID=A0A225WQW5_9STRA|nr:hypothetical protein PHMEG_0005630 [Phytophthora megakarya]
MDDDNVDNSEWTQIWRYNDSQLDRVRYLSEVLPRYATVRSELRNCTIDHLENGNIDVAMMRHTTRTILTSFHYERCNNTEDEDAVCMCRYKVTTCIVGNTTVVFQQGLHLMADDDVESPPHLHLTREMRDKLMHRLELNPTATAIQLFGLIVHLVDVDDLRGPLPTRSQLINFLRSWRPILPDSVTLSLLELEWEQKQILFAWYLDVQQQTSTTTVLHLDTTFMVVRQRYPVSVIGYSDKFGHFFPLGYFCTSRRKEPDMAWCIRSLKRAILNSFGEVFAPEFVMTDADTAQYNACSAELPTTVVLMCWYHVADNVFKQARSCGVEPKDTTKFFRYLYDLHFAPRLRSGKLKKWVLTKWNALPPGSPAYGMGQYPIRLLVNNHRFGKRQAFYTLSGCPTTNNPLEQYHRTLKRFCSDPRASPHDLLLSLDIARRTFLAEAHVFSNGSEAPVRLLKLYKQLRLQQCITAERMPPVGGVTSSRFCVVQLGLPLLPNDRKKKLKSIGSVNARRLQLGGMTANGWAVDSVSTWWLSL